MPYLVRKITRAKWESREGLAQGEIPSDVLTIDLRTSDNTLSFWQIENPSEEIELSKIALALATAGQRIERIDLTWVEAQELDSQGILMIPTAGQTLVQSLRDKHIEAINLDMTRICRVATRIDEAITQDRFKRFSQEKLITMVAEAVKLQLVTKDELAEKIREQIGKHLTS